MSRRRFDRLHTVQSVHESRNGCTQICRDEDGIYHVRLRITSPACQREFLEMSDERIPVRLEHGALELLLPWYEGLPLRQWLCEDTPTLGQRRDACLSLLEQMVAARGKLPPSLIALSADTGHLTVESGRISLRYLPDLRHWQVGIGEPQAVCAVAATICDVLAPDLGRRPLVRLPEELQLLHRRQREHDHTDWGQLQRDVAAVPDEFPSIRTVWRPYAQRIQRWAARWGTYVLRPLAVLLLAAALLSLSSAYRRQAEKKTVWEGMPLVGGQDLRKEGSEG